VFEASQLPIQPATLADLRGGDRADNARIVREVLSGTDHGPRRDAVLLNAGAALFVAGRVRSITEGWELGASLIDGGTAARKLDELARPA
jgi:anthranilate phosphoribosyltransferase